MATSQNGWPVIHPSDNNSPRLRRFNVPGTELEIPLRDGSAGFLLVHYLMWFNDKIEPLDGGQLDDWGYAYREIRGSTGWSNHASGTAADHNATKHPLGTTTFPYKVKVRIRSRLRLYRGCIRSGIFYSGRKDEMHIEIDRDLPTCEKRARALMDTTRGKAILAANPGLKAVILS